MSFNPNQFYLPPNGMPNPGMMPQQGYPGAPGQPQPPPFNLAALQQQQQQQVPPVQVPQRNGTPQQLPQGFPGVPVGMPQQFMGGGAPPGMMQQQQPQQHPSAGQVNMAAFEQLLRSGQLTPEQFATLQAQIRSHQQQQAQKQAQAQAQAVANASQQQQQQQHQQQQQPMAFLGGAPPPQQQQQPPLPMPPHTPAHAPQPLPVGGGEHIPIQLLQQYSAQLAQIRSLQQKVSLLGTVLQTGVVGGQPGTDGQVQGQTRLSPQQRPLVEKQLDETKRQLGGMVQTVQSFQKQWTQQRIQADFQFYQSQRTGQQSTPIQPQQPLPPPQQQQQQQQRPPLQAMPSGSAPNLYSSPQQQQQALTAQMLQRQAQAQAQMQAQAQAQAHAQAQAQAQAIAAAAAAGRSTPVQQPPQQLAPPPQQSFQPQPVLQQQQQQPPQQQLQQQQFMPTPQMMPPPAMPPLHLLQNQLNPQLFMKSLFEVMRKRGEPIDTTPYCDGREVDLYQLYQAVMVHGGSQQVNQHGTWHRIAAHLGYPADTSHQALRDAPPDTQRISLELARLYQKMLRPFEEIWGKSLVTQQQRILEAQRAGQAVAGMQPQPVPPPQQQHQLPQPQPPPPQQQQQAPQQPQRPPSQNAASRPGLQQAPSASQLEASRQQLLQQAKAASLAAQQVSAGGAALAAKQQQQQQQQAAQAQQSQQQLQNGGAAAGASMGKVNTEPTLEQVAEAKNSVAQIRLSIDQTRPKLKLLEVADDQKQAVARLTHELIPHVRKVMDTLPLFLAMTGDESAVRKMLTFAAIFQDQMRYMSTNQFALDLSGLTQLREQFQRCWNFMKQNPLGRGTGAAVGLQQQQRPAAQGAATSPPIKPEQFNAAAQGRGLRVEDLKPPPMKHRRTASGVAGTSPAAAPSPSTPQTAAGSPPQAGATPGATKPAKARRGAVKKEPAGGFAGSSPAAGASPAATLAALRSDLIKDSPSPMGIVVPPAPVLVPEEPPSLKRKREEDEMDRDPNAFIERTLRIIDQPAFAPADFGIAVGGGGGDGGGGAPTSGPAHAASLSLHLDPAVPPVVHDASAPPLSFAAYSSSSSYADALAPSFAAIDSTSAAATAAAATAAAPAEQPFDFDFYIDSSAAGFEVDAPTPDLVGSSSSGSAPTPATPAAATPQQSSHASLAKSPSKQSPLDTVVEDAALDDVYYGGGGLIVDSVDAWASKLSDAFSWEAQQGNDTPALASSSWNFYPEF